MQIFVKSFGGVRLYFSGEGKEGERLSRGIPLFCKRDIARRMQATRSSSCRPPLRRRRLRAAARARCLPPATGNTPASNSDAPSPDKPLLLNTTIRDYTLESLAHNRLLSASVHIEQ